MNVELAVKDEHGAWDFLGDYHTIEAAKDAAKEYASQNHTDACGCMTFGISEDPASGHYEIAYIVDTRSGEAWSA